ncbi:hypothetical protein AHAS_Ahas19G0266700 [Arachis hypogaea]
MTKLIQYSSRLHRLPMHQFPKPRRSAIGDFATETITLGSVSVPNVVIGCGHNNEGLFVGAAGLLGLRGGPLSFPPPWFLRLFPRLQNRRHLRDRAQVQLQL